MQQNEGIKKADDSVCSSLTSKNNDFACVLIAFIKKKKQILFVKDSKWEEK
jgi:hypothetical protein